MYVEKDIISNLNKCCAMAVASCVSKALMPAVAKPRNKEEHP